MKNVKNFNEISKLIKNARVESGMSQTELSEKLGYKNGQFVSNIERGLCGLPVKKSKKAAELLKIEIIDIMGATVTDFKNSCLEFVEKPNTSLAVVKLGE